MTGSTPDAFENLPLDIALQIDAIARRVEQEWRQGGSPQIERYLSDADSSIRGALLEELLTLELQYRDARGEAWHPDQYLVRFADDRLLVHRVLANRDAVPSDATDSSAARERDLPQVTGYQVLRLLGRGAMGVVYLARDTRLNRLVALKFMAAHFNFDQALSVVRAEAEIIARLKHPHIVQVYSFGTEQNEPYLALEYVDGETLQDRMRRERLSVRHAVELVVQLARAIHHAHTQGIIHRDLKPANVLLATDALTESHGLPAASAPHPPRSGNGATIPALLPKISDFGLAKVLDAFYDQTRAGAFLGTPKYMSPEQAAGNSGDVGPATDIYSLGTILFELLTNRPPFESQSTQELVRQILAEDPSFAVCPDVTIPRDLQAICLKCLEKEPERRYASADMLAQDLQRYLNGRPVHAQPPSRIDHAIKFVRRNRAFVLATSIAIVSLLATSVTVSFLAVREARARRDAEALAEREVAARREADELRSVSRQNLYLANVRLAQNAWGESRLQHMRSLLSAAHPQRPGDRDLRGFEWNYLWGLARDRGLTLSGHQGEVRSLAFRPDGQMLATSDWGGVIRLWDQRTGQIMREFAGLGGAVIDLGFSRDGRRIAAGVSDHSVRILDVESGELLRTLLGHNHWVHCVAFHPDGLHLLTADDREMVREWNLENGEPRWTVVAPERYAMDADYSPDGKHVALAAGFSDIRILDAADGHELAKWPGHDVWMSGIHFSPDGTRLATSGGDGVARVWDFASRQELFALRGHADWVTSVRFRADGKQLMTSSRDGTVKIWSADNGAHLLTLKGHTNWVMSCTFSPDGTRLASGSRDGTARVWPSEVNPEYRTVWEHDEQLTSLALSPDGQQVAAGTRNGSLALFAAEGALQGEPQQAHSMHVTAITFSPDGGMLGTTALDGTVTLWEARSGQSLRSLHPHVGPARSVAFHPAGNVVATAGNDSLVQLSDPTTGELLRTLRGHTGPCRAIAFHPDGKRMATCGEDTTIRFWNVETGEPLQHWTAHTDIVADIVFSPRGDQLASGGEDHTLRIWDTESGAPLHTLLGHANTVTRLAWSPDGRRIVSGSNDRTTRLWDTTTGQEVLTLKIFGDWVNDVEFAPSGTRILAVSNDRTLRFIDAPPHAEP